MGLQVTPPFSVGILVKTGVYTHVNSVVVAYYVTPWYHCAMRNDNRNNESDTTRRERAGSLAEPHRGTVLDSGADIAHDRHDEGAERRQELDLPPPLDARGNLAERVRATFTADAEDAAADAEGAAADAEGTDVDAEGAAAEARGRAAGVDGEKSTPILAALAQLRTKQSERARRGGPAPRLRPVPNVGRKPPPGRGLVGGGKIEERQKPPRRRAQDGAAPRRGSEGGGGVCARVRTHSLNTGI